MLVPFVMMIAIYCGRGGDAGIFVGVTGNTRLDAVFIAIDNDLYPSKCMLKYVR